MVATVGIYTQLTHDRDRDYKMVDEGEVSTILILQPEFSKILKLWKVIKNRPNAKLILRMWDWDDGRTEQNPQGVYRWLRDNPVEYGNWIVENWNKFLKDFYNRCSEENIPSSDVPNKNQILCHLINEPDTNDLSSQIDLSTEVSIERAEAYGIKLLCYNFGTGHPASLYNGEPDWRPFKKSLDLIRKLGHWVGLHEYFNDLGLYDESTNPWHVGRHTFRSARIALEGIKVIISEFGLEMLVNERMDRHHGYIGILSQEQFGGDIFQYANDICQEEEILIFASDLPDHVWDTFDPIHAFDPVVRVMRELRRLSEQEPTEPPIEPPVDPPDQLLIWPCDGTLTQMFGENPDTYNKLYGIPGHNGMDIGNNDGTIIQVVADGIVQWADWDDAYGNYARIWHEEYSMHSFYAHMASKAEVVGGQVVKQGQAVGRMGSTGNSTGPHLHFETRMGDQYSYKDVAYGYRRGRCNPQAVYAAHGIYW